MADPGLHAQISAMQRTVGNVAVTSLVGRGRPVTVQSYSVGKHQSRGEEGEELLAAFASKVNHQDWPDVAVHLQPFSNSDVMWLVNRMSVDEALHTRVAVQKTLKGWSRTTELLRLIDEAKPEARHAASAKSRDWTIYGSATLRMFPSDTSEHVELNDAKFHLEGLGNTKTRGEVHFESTEKGKAWSKPHGSQPVGYLKIDIDGTIKFGSPRDIMEFTGPGTVMYTTVPGGGTKGGGNIEFSIPGEAGANVGTDNLGASDELNMWDGGTLRGNWIVDSIEPQSSASKKGGR